jgi:hypothetical protein
MLFNLRACASHEGTGEGGIRTLAHLPVYRGIKKRKRDKNVINSRASGGPDADFDARPSQNDHWSMSFWKYWRDRALESLRTWYGIAQIVGFVLSLAGGLVLSAKTVWFLFSGAFVIGLLIEICFFSPYKYAKKLQLTIDAYDDTARIRREEQASRVLDKACELLKTSEIPGQFVMPFQGMYAAGAADLETNDQVQWVSDEIAEHHDHPMLGLEKCVLNEEWLDFLRWGKHHGSLRFDRGDDYLQGAMQWAVNHGRAESISSLKTAVIGEMLAQQRSGA